MLVRASEPRQAAAVVVAVGRLVGGEPRVRKLRPTGCGFMGVCRGCYPSCGVGGRKRRRG
jgi:hypothetical protein